MRKLLLGFVMLLISQFGFGQAVSDNAVIPVSVTLNSILRLQVTSGGNIQFVVNNIADYTSGILNSSRYDTKFIVSSSRKYTVTMATETSTNFVGLVTGGVLFLNNNIGYSVVGVGSAVAVGSEIGLTDTKEIINSAFPSGNVPYTIHWELGTKKATAGGLMNAQSLLDQSIPSDVYVQNIFLTLAQL